MFASRYFAPRYFAPRYFPNLGATAIPEGRCSLKVSANSFLAVDASGRLAISSEICADGLAIVRKRRHFIKNVGRGMN